MVHSSGFDIIKYWINSLPFTYCALFEEYSDLCDGQVLLAIICSVLGKESIPMIVISDEDIR